MRHVSLRLAAVTLGLLLLTLAGCIGASRTPPSVFYQLHSLADSNPTGQADASDHGISIAVGPITLPEYLDRPQMVIRNSQNVLELDEFHRWAGSLKQDFSSVLAENLSILLSTEHIAIFPYSQFVQTPYQVTVRVIRFDGNPGGSVSLVARWIIFDRKDRDDLVVKRFSLSEPTGKNDMEALVSAQSRLVEALSREIAAAIKEIAK